MRFPKLNVIVSSSNQVSLFLCDSSRFELLPSGWSLVCGSLFTGFTRLLCLCSDAQSKMPGIEQITCILPQSFQDNWTQLGKNNHVMYFTFVTSFVFVWVALVWGSDSLTLKKSEKKHDKNRQHEV